MPDRLILIVDDESQEPIVPALQNTLGPDVVSVWPLSHLLNDHGIRFSNGKLDYAATMFERDDISLKNILDRVVEITPATALIVDDSELTTIGQLSDAYQFILSSRESTRPNVLYSTVGQVVPLFSQWAHISRHFANIATPEYAYGYGPEIIADDVLPNAIHKSPFDLYSWRPNAPEAATAYDKFVVSRPLGEPVVSYIVGDHVNSMSLAGSDVNHEIACQATPMIAGVFGAEIGEVLWFVDEDRLTFAAFSHKLFAATQTPMFAESAQIILSNLHSLSRDWSTTRSSAAGPLCQKVRAAAAERTPA